MPPSPLSLDLYSRVLLPTELPFYKKHSKLTGTALKVTGGVLLAPIAIVGTLGIVGFGPAGVVAGNSITFPPKETQY